MKAIFTFLKSGIAIIAAFALIFTAGCSKIENSNGPSGSQEPERLITNQRLIDQIDRQIENIPAIMWYNNAMDKYLVIELQSESKIKDVPITITAFDEEEITGFSEHTDIVDILNAVPAGIQLGNTDFNPSTTINIRGLSPGNGGSTFANSPGGSSMGNGFSSFGNEVLHLNRVMILRSGESAFGNEVVHFGGINIPDVNNSYNLIGFDGDEEALQNTNFDPFEDIYNYIKGITYATVYPKTLTTTGSEFESLVGNYPVLNWFDELDMMSDYFHGNSFVYSYSFTPDSWNLNFSQNGNLKFKQDAIDFSGRFYGASLKLDYFGDSGNSSGHEIEYHENIFGFGEMKFEYIPYVD